MGSCDTTCAVSGLPIGTGDKVRYFLLTQNPYEELRCREEMHGTWYPRCFPLRAKYSGYDSIEEIEDTGPAQALWLEGLKQDLIEKGWGDNSAHDYAALKDMTFDQLLTAVREGRVFVESELRRTSTTEPSVEEVEKLDRLKHKELPTLRRILDLLKEHKQPLYEDPQGPNGYMVDDLQYGIVRIRWHEWGRLVPDEVHLSELLPLLKDYATVITAGSGSYAKEADLLVMVKPNDQRVGGPFHVVEKRRELLVCQAMIREDVWQQLLLQSGKMLTFKEDAHTLFKELLERIREHRTMGETVRSLVDAGALPATVEGTAETAAYVSLLLMGVGHQSRVGAWMTNNPVHFTVGLGTNVQLMLSQCLENKVSEEQLKAWIDNAAEFACIHNILRHTGYWWKPSYRSGPQFGEFREHEKVHKVYSAIAHIIADDQDSR